MGEVLAWREMRLYDGTRRLTDAERKKLDGIHESATRREEMDRPDLMPKWKRKRWSDCEQAKKRWAREAEERAKLAEAEQ